MMYLGYYIFLKHQPASSCLSHEVSIKDQSGFFFAATANAGVPKTVAGMAAQLSFPKDKKLL